MKESWLHFIWLRKLFSPHDLKSTKNLNLEIVRTGIANLQAGPDFTDCTIKINGVVLFGNVEIHIQTQDWYAHKHQNDPVYNTVVLHVVYESSHKEVICENGQILPELELKPYLLFPLESIRYHELKSLSIPCSPFMTLLKNELKRKILLSYFDDSLEAKLSKIQNMFIECKQDWERLFFVWTGMYSVDPANRDAIARLCLSVDLIWVQKKRTQPIMIESFIFGLSGIFETDHSTDVYYQQLSRQFKILKSLYQLEPLNRTFIKKGSSRPEAHTSIRLAWLCSLVISHDRLSEVFYHSNSIKEIRKLLDVQLSGYWSYHYDFGVLRKKSVKHILGKQGMDILLINAILPLCLFRARVLNQPNLTSKFYQFYFQLSSENNRIIRNLKTHGIVTSSAADSQAAMYLFKNFCSQYQCLTCKFSPYLLPDSNSINLVE